MQNTRIRFNTVEVILLAHRIYDALCDVYSIRKAIPPHFTHIK